MNIGTEISSKTVKTNLNGYPAIVQYPWALSLCTPLH